MCIENCRIIESNCAICHWFKFSQQFNHLVSTLYIPAASSPSVLLPRSVFPPQGKGYSVLLFEVDICIIRLGCVIVSGLPHQRVLQRREGAVQPNNGWLPSSLTLQPACTCIPHTHPPIRTAGRPRQQSTLGLAAHGGVRESERKGEGGGGGGGWSAWWEWEGRGWAEIFKHAECELALRG